MDSKELKALSDRMLDDEAAVMLGILSAREPRPIDQLADDVRGRRLCPNCGIPMWRNGTDNGHRKLNCY